MFHRHTTGSAYHAGIYFCQVYSLKQLRFLPVSSMMTIRASRTFVTTLPRPPSISRPSVVEPTISRPTRNASSLSNANESSLTGMSTHPRPSAASVSWRRVARKSEPSGDIKWQAFHKAHQESSSYVCISSFLGIMLHTFLKI